MYVYTYYIMCVTVSMLKKEHICVFPVQLRRCWPRPPPITSSLTLCQMERGCGGWGRVTVLGGGGGLHIINAVIQLLLVLLSTSHFVDSKKTRRTNAFVRRRSWRTLRRSARGLAAPPIATKVSWCWCGVNCSVGTGGADGTGSRDKVSPPLVSSPRREGTLGGGGLGGLYEVKKSVTNKQTFY